MEITDGVVGVIIGAVTGVGGVGGLWAYLRTKLTDDGETLRQFYADLGNELSSMRNHIETIERDHRADRERWHVEREELKAHIRAIQTEHAAERLEWHTERDALIRRIDELETRTSEVEELAP